MKHLLILLSLLLFSLTIISCAKKDSKSNTENTSSSKQYIIVGVEGIILTSTDGENWSSKSSGTSTGLLDITYGNNIFVTVGGGVILTSSDGNTWDSRTSGTTKNIWDITYGNSLYVAVGQDGIILTSSDGTTWTSRNSGTTNTLRGINYLEDKYWIVGE